MVDARHGIDRRGAGTVRRLPTLAERLIMLELVADQLTEWEVARVEQWRNYAFGSAKQAVVIDRIGERVYGLDVWSTFKQGVIL